MVQVSLTLTEDQCKLLQEHLFPEDGCEAVAIALCGRAIHGDRHRLLAKRIELIPYEECLERSPNRVKWPTDRLVPLLIEAAKHNWAIVKIHGHRYYHDFSSLDDASDRDLFPSVYAWTEGESPHASAIMMSDGSIFGRVVAENGKFSALSNVSIIGDDINISHLQSKSRSDVPEFGRRIAQTFGDGTFELLRGLRIAVIGCSGTGSPVIEQLARNCVGTLVIVDPDRIEEKNLNRILNATMSDAKAGSLKVDVAERAILAMGLGTQVETYPKTLFDREVVQAVASCDILFGCMDTVDGRFLLSRLSSFYMLPYFDLGVKIEADGQGGVDQVAGTVHYLKPGGSSLISRGVFTLEQVRAAGLKRTDPTQYRQQLEEGYIRGVQEDRPAVIQLNSLVASLAVNELLARLHPYRLDPNSNFAATRVSLSHGIFINEPDGKPCPIIGRHLGRGDVEPPLEWAELSTREGAP